MHTFMIAFNLYIHLISIHIHIRNTSQFLSENFFGPMSNALTYNNNMHYYSFENIHLKSVINYLCK